MTGIGSNANSAPRASVLLVGCGNMGFAFLKRWLDRRDATGNDYHVVEPNADLAERAKQAGATVYAGASDLPEGFDPIAVFFAVKPDMLAAVAPPYSVMRSAVFVSFAAGVPVAFFEECLGPRPIVRAMPNIPVVAGLRDDGVVLELIRHARAEGCGAGPTGARRFFACGRPRRADRRGNGGLRIRP